MKKIRIAFMSPEWKGWPYFIYKDFVDWLKNKYPNRFDIYFYNSKKDWLKLHFAKYDFIFSIIPFLFKPIWTKNFYISIYWNYNIEKKKNKLGNKLLYLMKFNINFADKILLSNLFLVNKIDFLKKYKDKFFILSNPIDTKLYNLKSKGFQKNILNDSINILTVSSTKFFEKWMWLVDLANQIKNIDNINITWTIIAWWNDEFTYKIQKEFYKNTFPSNIKIIWLWWLSKEDLDNYYKSSDIFIYWTRLEVWGQTIMEAMAHWLPIILLDYEWWKYTYPEEIITDNIKTSLEKVIYDYEFYSKIWINFIKQYDKDFIIDELYNFILKNK